MICPIIESHSTKVRGRLSSADGSRTPCSTKGILRARSPLFMPSIWGTATCDSSTIRSASSGRKSSRQCGRWPSAPPGFEQLHALLALGLEGDERPFHLLLGGHVVGGGEDRQLVAHGEDLTGQ